MKRPICEYCNNKVSDNTYVWIEAERILVHKICKMLKKEMIQNAVVTVSPIKMGTRVRR